MPRLQIKNKCFSVNRWMLENLDDIEFLYKVCILSSCYEIKHCSCCKHLLKWCLQILPNRWDEIRFINFFNAIKVLEQNKSFFTIDFYNWYWEKNEEKVLDLISFHKKADELLLAIVDNKELFEKFNYFMFFIKQYTYSLVKNTDNSLT